MLQTKWEKLEKAGRHHTSATEALDFCDPVTSKSSINAGWKLAASARGLFYCSSAWRRTGSCWYPFTKLERTRTGSPTTSTRLYR